jgi:hypothetical protein
MKYLSLLAVLLMGTSALAGPGDNPAEPSKPGQGQQAVSTQPATSPDTTSDVANADKGGPLHVEAIANFTSAYMFRGVDEYDHGLIFQPDITFSYDLYKSDNLTLTPKIDLWSSITPMLAMSKLG